MIKVKDDKSYMSELDTAAINNGIAELGIHSLRITNFYTDEQKQSNSNEYDTLTSEQWSERCDLIKRTNGEKIEKIIDILDNNFTIYQYKNVNVDYSKDNWDLFFWCNSGDMSYVTLSPNKKIANEQQLKTIEKALELLKTMDVEGIQVVIQYIAIYNDEKVKNAVTDYCTLMKDKMIDYGGYVGKIVEFNGRYVFRKKGAKKNAYEINSNAVLKNVFSL